MTKLPSISIVTYTYNTNLDTFERTLKALKNQGYPKRLIEHIIIDAGSTNGCVELAKKYGCKVFLRPDLVDEEQMRASIGYKKAKGKIILIIQSDNIVVGRDWFKKMVEPFKEKGVFCTYTAHYSYKKNMSAITRYGALIGANDPLISPFFLDKIEKVNMITKRYNKGKILKENKNYYIVKFDKNNFPPLGDNGQMVLRSVMEKVNKDPKKYLHLDTFAKMFDLGYDTCGVVKSSIIHVITPDITKFVIRRIQLKEKFFDNRKDKRRFLIYDKNSNKDKINLLKFIFFSATFVFPLLQSTKGYLRIRDRAWFLHPFICFLMLAAYSYSEIKWIIRRLVS